MVAQTEGPPAKQGKPVKRHLRNFLLDPRFQLKYTGMVVAVTMLVASLLGAVAYSFSQGQTELLTVNIAASPDIDPAAAADLAGYAEAEDQKVLLGIIAGILLMGFALAATGIIVTHKIIGPAYKMRLLLNDVAAGHLKLKGRLRKGDELQELFEAFANMVESLRESQSREVAELDAALEEARADGVGESALLHIIEVRDRMKATLD